MQRGNVLSSFENLARVLLTLAILWPLCVGQPALAQKDATAQVVFYAMGDVPYAPAEDEQLPRQVEEIPGDAEFVVHVGDIKPGSMPCDESVYNKVFAMLAQSKAPVFIIPGDNEWNDCGDPEQAWHLWEKYFMRFDRRWSHHLPVYRQLEREENFSFVSGGVLFVGLNLVGGRVHDSQEWQTRHAQDLEWTRRNLSVFGDEVSCLVLFGHAKPNENHQDFFEPFQEDAKGFGKPILYLHGDGHRWIHDRPFPADNILRVQVDQGGIAPPLKVTVSKDAAEPFQFDRRMETPEKD